MTPAEKQAFDLMRESLRQLQRHHSEMVSLHGHGFAHFVCKLIDTAALAADAVAEQGQAPQPEFDLTTLITNGAKAWAGVNAQDLREGKPVGEPPMSRERWLAIREGHFNAAAEQYFNARPQLDTAAQRRVFYAGHCAGYGEPQAESEAERMAGARAKHDDTYPSDLLARMENEPK